MGAETMLLFACAAMALSSLSCTSLLRGPPCSVEGRCALANDGVAHTLDELIGDGHAVDLAGELVLLVETVGVAGVDVTANVSQPGEMVRVFDCDACRWTGACISCEISASMIRLNTFKDHSDSR